MKRTLPQVRSAAFEITTGKSVGFCAETSQPGRSEGGVGAVAQAVAPLPAGVVAALVGPALGFVPPHAAITVTSASASTAARGTNEVREDMEVA